MPCSLGAFVLITHSVYGVQCFLTEYWGFVNVFLPTLDPSFLVVGDNRCNFAVYKGIHCKVKKQQVVRRLEGSNLGGWKPIQSVPRYLSS